MKSIYAPIFLLSLAISTSAQKEGVVLYEQTRKTTFRVPPQMADMMPKHIEIQMILTFNENESIYKAAPVDEDLANTISPTRIERMQMRFKRMRANSEIYRNLEGKVTIEKQTFMGRDFLFNGANEKIKWKMSSDQRKIAGYVCMKSTYMRNDTIPVTAWWTPQIPIANGPGNNGQLPGLVLALDINNGDDVTVAIKVDLRTLTEDEQIVRPDKGKKVTREEFDKMREDKMKEMEEMGGGGRIRMRRN